MMHQRLATAAVLLCALVVTAAKADTSGAVSVMSGGAAHDCFSAAVFAGSSRNDIQACSDALASGTLTTEDRAATFINRGILKDRMSDYQGALSDYSAGLKVDPELVDAYIDRGAVSIQLGRYDDAIADLTKAISLGTKNPEAAYYDRGLVRERTRDVVGACEDFRQSLALRPNFIPARLSVSICRYDKDAKPN